MSELRQRKGGEAAAVTEKPEVAKSQKEQEADSAKFIDDVNSRLDQQKPNPVVGLSNEAKEWKIALDKDEKNMELVFKLGVQYCVDQQWAKAINVLMRGWKRVDELQDKSVRNEFLIALTQASEKESKYKQALAVVGDVEDVEDEEVQQKIDCLRCRVYCQVGDKEKGLRALSKSIKGLEFQSAAAQWATLIGPLKKCGAYDASKSNIVAMASSDKEKETLEAMEKLAAYRDEYFEQSKVQPMPNSSKILLAIGLVSTIAFFFVLYTLETKSLERLPFAK